MADFVAARKEVNYSTRRTRGSELVVKLLSINFSSQLWKQTLKVASGFWGVCLFLVAIEAAVGDNAVTATIFFLSVPVLVGYLMWANWQLMILVRERLLAVFVLGVYVLCSATVIVFVGLFAAANLKTLMIGV